MTDDEWNMVQKTPEWLAARAKHEQLVRKERRKLDDKHIRIEQAMYARHIREHEARKAKRQAEQDKLAQKHFDLENAGCDSVFAKYGLKPGRG